MNAIGWCSAWVRRTTRCLGSRTAAVGALALIASWAVAAGAPSAGDVYVYRLTNGYNNETSGQLRYEVNRVDAKRVTLTVTPDRVSADDSRTDVLSADGNGIRELLYSHGALVEYQFAKPYPAYAFPLSDGKRWSERVDARVGGARKARSVRVDGRVLGRERVRVPAGEFDAIKIRRSIYAGDAMNFQEETQIYEDEWYAPALGRWVRKVTRSEYLDTSQCTRFGGCDIQGPWDILELEKITRAGAPN